MVDIFQDKGVEPSQGMLSTNTPVDIFDDKGITNIPVYNMGQDKEVDAEIDHNKNQWGDIAKSVFTERELLEIKSKGTIDFFEAAKKDADLPFYSIGEDAYDRIKLANISKKIVNNEEVSDAENEVLISYMRNEAEKAIRGYSIRGKIGSGFAQVPAFMVELAAFGGFGKFAAAGAVKASEKVLQKSLGKVAKKVVAATAGTAAISSALVPLQAPAEYGQRRLNEYMALTDKGEVFFREAQEKPFTTALKAAGTTGIEVVSEKTGGAISAVVTKPIAKLASPYVNKVGSALFDKLSPKVKDVIYRAYKEIKPTAKMAEVFSYDGWNGIIEEIGEERIGDLMRVALDLDEQEGYSIDQVMKALYPGAEQLLVEAGVMTLIGTTRSATNGTASFVSKAAEKKLGLSKSQSEDMIKSLSQTEIDGLFKDLSKEQVTTQLKKIEGAAFELAKGQNITEDESRAWSKLMAGNSLWGAVNYNISPEKYWKDLQIGIENYKGLPRSQKEIQEILNFEPDYTGGAEFPFQEKINELRTYQQKLEKQHARQKKAMEKAVAEGRKYRPRTQKATSPILKYLNSKGGVLIGSELASELEVMGITPKTDPWLFRKKGVRVATGQGVQVIEPLSSLDTIDKDDINSFVGQYFENDKTHEGDDSGYYVGRDALLNAIDKEVRGGKQGDLLDESMDSWFDDALRYLDMAGVSLENTDEEINAALMAFERGDKLFQSEAQADFLQSALIREAQNLKQEKGSGEQFLAMLRKTSGIKEEEIAWTGLDEYLKGKKSVTKNEIVDYLNENQVQIEEVTLAISEGRFNREDLDNASTNRGLANRDLIQKAQEIGYTQVDAMNLQFKLSDSRLGVLDLEPELQDYARALIEADQEYDKIKEGQTQSATKFAQYTLPGGDNYREVLLTLPEQSSISEEDFYLEAGYPKEKFDALSDAKKESLRKLYESRISRESSKTSFKSSHFDQANILAHVRLNDRVDAEGKKVLFVEEIQSDWHQTGRKKGYKGVLDEKDFDAWIQKNRGKDDPLNLEDAKQRPDYQEFVDAYLNEQDSAVPDAPFKKSWHEMAFRRIAQMAAQNGYDAVAWTPGEVQNERYDLSKQVDKIVVPMVNENSRSVRIDAPDGKSFKMMVSNDGIVSEGVHAAQQFTGKPLDEVVGKDMAEKIMALAEPGEFSGDGLKVGGEGMKGFYDKILKSYADKFGKKYGASVGVGKIKIPPQKVAGFENDPSFTSQEKQEIRNGFNKDVWTLPITDAMRESAQQGFTLFQTGDYMRNNMGVRGSVQFMQDGRKIISILNTADESTLLHETGHIFLRQLRDASGKSLAAQDQYKAILKYLGNEGEPLTREQEEKFARGFERYLMEGVAPSNALRDAFESFRDWLVSIYQNVMGLDVPMNNEARKVYDALLGGKDLDIYFQPVEIDNHESGWAKFYRYWIDDLLPISQVVKKAEDIRGAFPDGTSPNYLARLFAASKGRLLQNLQNNTYYIDESGKPVITGEGIKTVFEDFDHEFGEIENDYETRFDDFESYLIAKRYLEDLQGREDVEVTPRQLEESAETIALLSEKYGENYERFNHYAERVYKFQERILENLVRSGMLSQEQYDKILNENKNYIPFQRVFEEHEIEGEFFAVGGRGKFTSAGQPVKKIKGSQREVKDVFAQILINSARVITAAEKNKVMRSIADLAPYLPENIKAVKRPMSKITLDDGSVTYRPSGKPEGAVIQYRADGKIKFVEVSKPLYEAMQGMHPVEIGAFLRIIQGVSSFFRTAATITPEFIARNYIRDVMTGTVQSEKGTKPVDIVKGLLAVAGKNDLYNEWMQSGGSFNSYMELDEKGAQRALQELIRPRGRMMRYLRTGGIGALQDLSGVIEQANRVAVYRRARLSGETPVAAAFQSRDATLDFSRAGKVGRIANRYIPFLNAGIQGSDKLIRAFKNNPKAMLWRGFTTITIPSVIITGYYLYGASDDEREEYLNIPQWQKDMFWVFKANGTWWRIPKPFSLGYAFGSTIERFMLWSYQGDKPEAENLWREFVLGIGGSLSPIQDVGALLTPIGRITVESLSNYNFFTGRSIYPDWMDSLPQEERATKYQSETAMLLGELSGQSPAIIENAIRGFLATSTPYVLGAGDYLINSVKEWNGEDIPEQPITPADLMFIRGFSVRSPEGYRSVSAKNFYDRFSEIKERRTAYNQKKGEERAEYFEKYGELIRMYNPMKNYAERISNISEKIDRIYDDVDMSSEDKVYEIEELEKQITQIAKEGNARYMEEME